MERKVECWPVGGDIVEYSSPNICWCNMGRWIYCKVWNGGDIVEHGMMEILWIMECWRYCGTRNGGDIVEQGMVEETGGAVVCGGGEEQFLVPD